MYSVAKIKVEVRDAVAEDREAILRIVVAAYSQYEAVMSPARWLDYKASIIQSVDKEGPHSRIIAEVNGEIVGSVLLFTSSAIAYGRPELGIESPIIRLLGVAPEARGLGVATELIKESIRRSLALGASTLHLHTSDLMASAIKLYEKLGFERATDKEMYNGDVLVKCYKLQLQETALLSS
ncbi:GNAT family N-acetyltransferase [Paenibacillus sp. BIHB 4019]|uniref:GNAT family N-acetyltransferase n=1 Tax=Paenibacillus sp. BIHB 4019 TaxID=1870819 RepID=A0A1B2DK62_9BACL|nr:GNAT family N-acetyltransferase [Paenibacillus sp. BIHB 4019]